MPPDFYPSKVIFLTVNTDSEGQRLDNFLIKVLKDVPKTHLYKRIRQGDIRLNKKRTTPDTRLALGDTVRIAPLRSQLLQKTPSSTTSYGNKYSQLTPISIENQDISGAISFKKLVKYRNFEKLLEDDYLLAINKPAGIAVHGGSGIDFGVIEQLRQQYSHMHSVQTPSFLELVHRLDRETSGILLIAKRRSALLHLQEQFKLRQTAKTYLALVIGEYKASHKVIDKPLYKYVLPNGERRVKISDKSDANAMKAITLVNVLKTWPASVQTNHTAYSLLQVTIKTGRTHQIRVHLAHTGCPIVGDDKYGQFDTNKRLQKLNAKPSPLHRMFLHAWRLTLQHPKTGNEINLEADLPDELQHFINALDASPN